MKLFLTTICAVLLLSNVRTIFGANILAIVSCPAMSHFNVFKPLILELTKRGHNLWVVSHFPQKTTGTRNYVDIDISGSTPVFHNNVSLAILDLYTDNYLWLYYNLVDLFEDVKQTAQTLETDGMKQLLKTDVKFDLILTEIFTTDIFLGFAYKFKVPWISIVTSMPQPWSYDRVNNIENPSYTTHIFSQHAGKMDFKQRLANTVDFVFSKLAYAYYNYYSEKVARRFFGEDLPPLNSLVKNTSMIFVNSYSVFNGVRPNTPQVIEIGGIHMKPAGQLPHVSSAILISVLCIIVAWSLTLEVGG